MLIFPPGEKSKRSVRSFWRLLVGAKIEGQFHFYIKQSEDSLTHFAIQFASFSTVIVEGPEPEWIPGNSDAFGYLHIYVSRGSNRFGIFCRRPWCSWLTMSMCVYVCARTHTKRPFWKRDSSSSLWEVHSIKLPRPPAQLKWCSPSSTLTLELATQEAKRKDLSYGILDILVWALANFGLGLEGM